MNAILPRIVVAAISGTLFGFGLAVSGLLDPEKVRGFLDVTGNWDPTLFFVLAGAVGIAALGSLLRRLMSKPLCDTRFHISDRSVIDKNLIVGSALFGIGWAIAGLCPGPALASLGRDVSPIYVFVLAMIAGILIYGDRTDRESEPSEK